MRKIFSILLILSAGIFVQAETIVWKGEKLISKPVVLAWGKTLKIMPGTKVKFTGNGQLICRRKITLEAEGATFSADKPLRGKSRMLLQDSKSSFVNCRFDNLVTVKKKFHDAAISVMKGSCKFQDNVFTSCSALELMLINDSDVSWNVFTSCTKALVLFHTRNARVVSNTFRNCKSSSLRLNSADTSMILNNRFYNPDIAVMLYRSTEDNIICATSVFGGNCAFQLRALPRRNLIARVYTKNTKFGITLWNNGPGNIVTGFSFNGGNRGVVERKSKFKFPLKLIESGSLSPNK